MISPQKLQALQDKMVLLGIRESDLDETFVRSSGAGGQHVNKTASCVQLVHRPTGIAVKCQQDRSQAMNRYLARRLLVEKIEAERLGRQSAEQQKWEKIRRQKRRRTRRGKEKMLADKHRRSQTLGARRVSEDWGE